MRRTCLRFVGSVGVYVLLDYLFVYCFLNTEVSIHIFRGICLLFYMIYVTLPLAWYHFLQSYIGKFKSQAVQRIVYIPYFVLLAMLVSGIFSQDSLWVINESVRYGRGFLFDVFVLLNLFYFAVPVIRMIYILCRGGRKENPYLIKALLCWIWFVSKAVKWSLMNRVST